MLHDTERTTPFRSASRFADGEVGRVGRVRRVGQWFQKIAEAQSKPESQALLTIGASVDRLRRFSERIGSTTSAGGERSISQVAGDFEGGGIAQHNTIRRQGAVQP